MGLVARKTAALLGSAAIALAAGTISGWAQDGVTEDEAQVQEKTKQGRVTVLQRIVVGAGQEKVAIDTPQAVTVVEQEEIDRVQAETIGEVLRTIPGVNTSASDRVLGQGFNIRGIGAPEAAGEEGRIIVTVDGATKFYEQYRMGGFFSDPELYKKVEVLRGPASSTLYGSGAIGGVINFITKDASDFIADGETGSLKLKGGYNSNRDGWLGSFVFAQRFNEDFDFLLAGNYRRTDEYQTGNGTTISGSDFEGWSGLAKATWNVGEEGKLRLSYQQWDSDANNQDYQQTGGTNFFGTIDRHVIDRTAVVTYENPFSESDILNLKISASISQTTVKQENSSGASFAPGTPPAVCGDPGADTFCDVDYGYRTFELKAENTSEWHGANWENFLTYGLQLAHQQRTAEAYRPTGTAFGHGHHPEGTDFKTGLFAQNEYIWDERLTLISGLRLDHRTLNPAGSTGLTESNSEWAYSPKFAAHYKFNDAFAIFGSAAHTQRFATIDEVFSTSGSQNQFLPSYDLKKERSNNFEAGFALSGYDVIQSNDSIQFKFTGFHNYVTDLISLNPSLPSSGFGNMPGYVNINKAVIYGAEMELAYDSDYFFANASYSHVIGKNEITGNYLTSVAPHELGLTLGGKLPEQGLTFGWRARFVAGPQDSRRDSEVPVIVPPETRSSTRHAKSFNVHDVFLTWKPQDDKFRGWEVAAGVDNIFDKQYKEFLHNEPAKGRTFKLSLSKQFGW